MIFDAKLRKKTKFGVSLEDIDEFLHKIRTKTEKMSKIAIYSKVFCTFATILRTNLPVSFGYLEL